MKLFYDNNDRPDAKRLRDKRLDWPIELGNQQSNPDDVVSYSATSAELKILTVKSVIAPTFVIAQKNAGTLLAWTMCSENSNNTTFMSPCQRPG